MDYIHVRNLEKFHPGYKDRTLQWAKIYINMANGDPDLEMIDDEVDWARLIKIILLELRAQKPLPNTSQYWQMKGFNIKKRPMSLTIKMLHNFLDVVTEDENDRHVDKKREDKKREDILSCKHDLETPILYLNEKAKTKYNPKTEATRRLVKARYNEGRTLEDFKKVIDRKCAEWLTDEKMMQYLRPSTLFNATNFENYLNKPINEDLEMKKRLGLC